MGPVAVFAAAVLLLLSPLMRGGNRQVALIALEAIALLFLLSLWVRSVMCSGPQATVNPVPRHRKLLLGLLLLSPAWLAVVYLTPVGIGLVSALNGRAIYGELAASAAIAVRRSMPLSLVPDATAASLLSGIPLVAGFLAGYTARLSQLRVLLGIVAAMAFVQVTIGLLQAAGGSSSSLYFTTEFAGRPVGTFANANHLANYVAMGLAGYTWLGWNSIKTRTDGSARLSERQILPLWIAGGLMLVFGILMTLSRGAALSGLPAALIAVCVAYLASGRPRSWRTALLLLIAVFVVAGALVGAGTLLSRFDLSRLATDASFRTLVASSTFNGAREFWPWGAGWGTFAPVFPRFQPVAVDGHAEHAHQDYAQMLMEGGVFALLLACAFTWLAITRAVLLMRRRLSKGTLESDEVAAAVCGIGLLGFLIHSLVEFNMHIPANAILAALLAGAYLRPLRAHGSFI